MEGFTQVTRRAFFTGEDDSISSTLSGPMELAAAGSFATGIYEQLGNSFPSPGSYDFSAESQVGEPKIILEEIWRAGVLDRAKPTTSPRYLQYRVGP